MKDIKVIGITGKARSGKDTAAEIINASVAAAVPYSFADFIRRTIWELIFVFTSNPEVATEHCFGDKKEEPVPGIGKSFREMAQTLGTEWGREHVSDTLWVDLAKSIISTLEEQGCPLVIIPDVRFENEAKMLQEYDNGYLIKIERDVDAVGIDGHASEAGIGDEYIDAVITNDASLEEYHEAIIATVDKMIPDLIEVDVNEDHKDEDDEG